MCFTTFYFEDKIVYQFIKEYYIFNTALVGFNMMKVGTTT